MCVSVSDTVCVCVCVRACVRASVRVYHQGLQRGDYAEGHGGDDALELYGERG